MFSKLDFGFQGVILGMAGYHPIPCRLALASTGPLVRRQRPWPAMELYWRNGLEELDMPGSDAPRFGKESLHLMSWWVSWLMSGRVDDVYICFEAGRPPECSFLLIYEIEISQVITSFHHHIKTWNLTIYFNASFPEVNLCHLNQLAFII